nr:alpha-amylase family protein [uncultured Rhodopila sp.]
MGVRDLLPIAEEGDLTAAPIRHADEGRHPRLWLSRARRGWRATEHAREGFARHDGSGGRADGSNLNAVGFITVLALLTGSARAAPFDAFELIMWQDHTPVQIAGLARLGFTATKLRATGGQIDPSTLADRQASGLPWYLENIATDFYAPYHRYTPGKAVTWRFDAAKARLRADPADTGVFVREPGLSDPVWLTAVQSRLEQVVHDQSRYRPLFYNLADEPGIGDLAAAWDADIAPSSLTEMRQWLKTQYADIAALNRQWGTDFRDWDAVVPELTVAAMRRTDDNYSAWADFKAWMDIAFARAVRAGTDAVHRADATALAGLEGGQVPGWGGYDYSLLAPAVDVMEIYDFDNALDLARAFNPALITLRTSFPSGPREAHALWRNLLHGGRGLIVWDERGDVVQPDGAAGPRGREIADMVAALRLVAPAIMAAEASDDPVAVLYSQASFRTRWMLDQRTKGAAWTSRDAAREYEDNSWRASRRQVLARLAGIAVQPRILSSAMVEAGALQRDGLRVLILPHAIALSEAEANEIRAFAGRGGTVLADTEPGLFDQHSRRLPAPSLTGVAVLPEAMLLGAGADGPIALAAFAALLRDAGVPARAELRGPDGLPAAGVEARWLRQGDTTILALQAAAPWQAPGRIELRLDAPATIEDLRFPGPVRRTQQVSAVLDPVVPTILSVRR